MALVGQRCGSADSCLDEGRFQWWSSSRWLVSLGSLSVPRLQARGSILTGFDMEIERGLARIMGIEITFPEIAWEDHVAALAAGTVDTPAGARATEARSLFA